MDSRNALLDHWKLLLIFLVVLGHTIPGNPVIFAMIYSFHMPAFIFLLGMTSRVVPSRRGQFEAVVLLVVTQVVYYGYVSLFGWEVIRWWSRPIFVLWFFASMVCWRFLLRPLLATGRPMTIAIALCLGVGITSRIGVDYSLSRTLVFLPFFVAGHLHGQRFLLWVQQDRSRFAVFAHAIAGLLIALGFALAVQGHTILLEGKESYRMMGYDRFDGLLLRTCALVVATLVSTCFFVAASRPFGWSRNGRHSRSVFLLHAFFTIPAAELLIETADHGSRLFGVVFVGSMGLVALLSRPVFARMLDRMLAWVTRPMRLLRISPPGQSGSRSGFLS